MNRTKLFFSGLFLVYVFFGILAFPTWKNHVGIPGIILVGITGWQYGRTWGFLTVILITANQFLLCNIVYPLESVYYEDRAFGTLVMISVAWLSGTFRTTHDNLKETTSKLEKSIAVRSRELDELATQLIDRAETSRIIMGEQLHDGIGQELTGIQLYCGALEEELVAENSTSAALAFSLRCRAEKAHHLIRATARSLFPIKLQQTGLTAALNELSACIMGTKQVELTMQGQEQLINVPHSHALQVYRIVQEGLTYVANSSSVSRIGLDIRRGPSELCMELQHDGRPLDMNRTNDLDARILKYRLKTVCGEITGSTDPQKIVFSIKI